MVIPLFVRFALSAVCPSICGTGDTGEMAQAAVDRNSDEAAEMQAK
jgi:hypothetical protein